MIEVRELTKRYGRTLAVDRLTVTVRPGRVTGFLGPNGAGKSTTMRAALGLSRPDTGEVLIEGSPYRRLRQPLCRVGALLDAGATHRGRRAYHHLLWLARSNRIPRGRIDEVLALVGLEPVARRRTGAFSLGMAQRLGIAAALLGDPPVLLFDEPVNGLDPQGVRWLRELFRRFAAEGRTVLVSSHLMSEVALTADHLVVIARGRLLADTSLARFVAEHAGSHVRVRTPQPDRLRAALAAAGAGVGTGADGALAVTGLDAAAVGELAGAAGVTVHEVATHTASLEDAFMRLIGDTR